ncbi:MAG: hypothetical protein L0Z49_14175 [Actinobacteria bacterium]|nr:hypothetical protein [Actinomycetota bacterium]
MKGLSVLREHFFKDNIRGREITVIPHEKEGGGHLYFVVIDKAAWLTKKELKALYKVTGARPR